MKYLIFPLVALGFGTAALAQPPSTASAPKSYPPCSKSVTDECMGSSHEGAHHAAMRPAAHSMASHHHKMAARHHKMAAHHRPHHMAHAARHGTKAKPEPKSS